MNTAFAKVSWTCGDNRVTSETSPLFNPGNGPPCIAFPCLIVLLAIRVLGHGFTVEQPKHVHKRMFLTVTSWLFSILGRCMRRRRGNIPMKIFRTQSGRGGGTDGRKCSCIVAAVVASDTVTSIRVRIRYWTRSGTDVEAGGNSSRNSKKKTMSENRTLVLKEIFSRLPDGK